MAARRPRPCRDEESGDGARSRRYPPVWGTGAQGPAGRPAATTISRAGSTPVPLFFRAGEPRDYTRYADLRPVGCRRRPWRRLLALRRGRPQISRFHQRHRRDRARPLPPASGRSRPRAGRAAVAQLEPVPHPGAGAAGAAARRQQLCRHRLFRQFGCGGLRIGAEGRAQIPARVPAIPSATASSAAKARFTAAPSPPSRLPATRSISKASARRWTVSTMSPLAI